MKESVAKNPLAYEKISKLVAKFAIPAIISMLVNSMYNIVDQIFIGQGVGMLGNAATNIAFPTVIMCIGPGLLFGIGGASAFNIRSGQGRDDEAKQVMGTVLTTMVIIGCCVMAFVLIFLKPLMVAFGATDEVLPYALDYVRITSWGFPALILGCGGNHLIRADRRPTFSMMVMLSGNIINIILDALFIFPLGMGIAGAALATIIGQYISAALIVIYFGKLSNVKLKKEEFIPKAWCVKIAAALGVSSFINQMANMAFQIIMNNVLRKYGAESVYGPEIPLAVVGIITKVTTIFMSISIGISQGSQPIFGFNFGAKQYDRVKLTYKFDMVICFIVGIVFFILFQTMPRTIISWFGTGSEAYFEFGVRYFRIFLFMTFLNAIQPMSGGFFTSIGRAKIGAIVSLTRQVLFLIPMVIIFPMIWGIDGVMLAGPISDLVTFFVTIFFVVKQFRFMDKLARGEAVSNV